MVRYSRSQTWSARSRGGRLVVAIAATTLLAAGCAGREKKIALDVDVYLHATSSDATDVLLQAAVAKRLGDSDATRTAAVHVRVIDGIVALDGTVRTPAIRDAAERLARETDLTLNGAPIRPSGDVRNQIVVGR